GLKAPGANPTHHGPDAFVAADFAMDCSSAVCLHGGTRMRLILISWILTLVLAGSPGWAGPKPLPLATAAAKASAATPTNPPPFWLIPHTHWEGAVFKTREEYLEMGLPNILTAVRLLKEQPNYCFVLDQVAYFKPFLERYPEEAAAFRKFI